MAERPSSRPEKRPHASGDDDEDSDDRESCVKNGENTWVSVVDGLFPFCVCSE
eukprot:m.63616 g.63616  ORF g.63616 m.63616 type:complete len:53 (+) comp35176_c1_seq7:14-172(+)